jgi:hypothetical protein
MFTIADATESSRAPTHSSISGDGALIPPPFYGLPTENAHEWSNYFTRYVKYKRLDAEQALELFVVLLRGSAATAFSTLDAATQSNHVKVGKWFDDRYKFSPRRKFQLGQELLLRKQAAGESVDDFFVAIQALARQIDDKPSNDLIRHAITSGLRPTIAGHVMAFAAKADSIDELLEAARVAELMTAATPDASAIESLVAEVKRLGSRIDASTTRSVRSPSTERRPVTFADRAPTPPPSRQTSTYNRSNGQANAVYYNKAGHQQQPGNQLSCPNCFGKHGPRPTDCFAFGKSCYICSGSHHYARCHRSGPNRPTGPTGNLNH